MKKKARALALLTTTALFASIPALAYGAGWEQDEQGYWYELEDGSYPADAWMEIDGSWYHFDEKGYMQTGWYRDGRGRRFWLGGDGKMPQYQIHRYVLFALLTGKRKRRYHVCQRARYHGHRYPGLWRRRSGRICHKRTGTLLSRV